MLYVRPVLFLLFFPFSRTLSLNPTCEIVYPLSLYSLTMSHISLPPPSLSPFSFPTRFPDTYVVSQQRSQRIYLTARS
ncbi:hypothetical protein GE09DRAFT_1069950 [Coniochaeta sp. 2T2.1]|nr:hypothetical protein GE09DRAFT_1069950 [Coniochaeta sp. 2T2.1]